MSSLLGSGYRVRVYGAEHSSNNPERNGAEAHPGEAASAYPQGAGVLPPGRQVASHHERYALKDASRALTAATPANNDSCGLRSDGGQARAPHQRGVKAL